MLHGGNIGIIDILGSSNVYYDLDRYIWLELFVVIIRPDLVDCFLYKIHSSVLVLM